MRSRRKAIVGTHRRRNIDYYYYYYFLLHTTHKSIPLTYCFAYSFSVFIVLLLFSSIRAKKCKKLSLLLFFIIIIFFLYLSLYIYIFVYTLLLLPCTQRNKVFFFSVLFSLLRFFFFCFLLCSCVHPAFFPERWDCCQRRRSYGLGESRKGVLVHL